MGDLVGADKGGRRFLVGGYCVFDGGEGAWLGFNLRRKFKFGSEANGGKEGADGAVGGVI